MTCLSPLDCLDGSREDLYDLAHVAEWERYDQHDLTNASKVRVGSILCADLAQHLKRACTGCAIDYLDYLDRHLSGA